MTWNRRREHVLAASSTPLGGVSPAVARDGRGYELERHHRKLLERACRALDQVIDAE